jgi:signal transduction histidine kinase
MDESALVTYANSKMEIFLGHPKAQIVGHKFHDWSQEETLSDFFARFQNAQSRLRRKRELTFLPTYLPGKTLALGAYPVETGDNKTFMGTLILCRDVTSEALAKQARGDFVAHVAHELKSPLNVLKMYSELLMGEEGNEEEIRREAANVISDEVERLSLLINNLLSISKIEMGSIGLQRQRVKVLDLLTDAFQTVARCGKGEELEFKLDLPHDLSPLSLDKDLFRVALNNLLTNAIKYNRPQGQVTLSAEETDTQIIIQVQDTGFGIAEQDQGHIFEKFYRSDNDEVRQKPGHGLGLSLAKNIIDVHHGKLQLESTLGVGSTFSITFDKGAGLVQEGL